MRATIGLVASAWLLSGCGALIIPVAAGAAIGRNKLVGRDEAQAAGGVAKPTKAQRREAKALAKAQKASPGIRLLPQGSVLPPPRGVASSAGSTATAAGSVPATMQYLYGSGEAAAVSLQAYASLRNYLTAEARLRELKVEPDAVVMAPGATLAAPTFLACQGKPLAVVFDIDETVVSNLGYEADAAIRGEAFDEARWGRWEATGADRVRAVPGAAAAIAAARKLGIAVVFNSNRLAANATATQAALGRAGLGETVVGDTLWLRGPGDPSAKDMRRWQIAQKYCVIALVGDQLGDFSDLFNAAPATASIAARRTAPEAAMIAPMWGAGWFVLPNPVYGTALKGGMDDVFPPDTRWRDETPDATKAAR